MVITDIFNQEWHIDCIGCAITSSKINPPGGIITENKSFQVHQDVEVPIEGFLIIGSKRHVQSISHFTSEEYEDFCKILLYSRNALKSLQDIRSVTIIQEERSQHFHLWLFPWYDWIYKKYDWLIKEYREMQLSCIRPILRQAKETLKTSAQAKRILNCIERLKNYGI